MKSAELNPSLVNMHTSENKGYCPECQYPVEVCQCARERAELAAVKARRERGEIARLGGLRAYRDFTLELFRDKKAAAECAVFPKQSLFICGPTGCGKTHLGTAILRQQGGTVLKPMEMLRRLRACESADDESALLEAYGTFPLLIDDLGVEKLTEYALQVIYEVIDHRWMNAAGGLIITSNLDLDGLSRKLGEDRIVSRIAGMSKVIALSGTDWRLRDGK